MSRDMVAVAQLVTVKHSGYDAVTSRLFSPIHVLSLLITALPGGGSSLMAIMNNVESPAESSAVKANQGH